MRLMTLMRLLIPSSWPVHGPTHPRQNARPVFARPLGKQLQALEAALRAVLQQLPPASSPLPRITSSPQTLEGLLEYEDRHERLVGLKPLPQRHLLAALELVCIAQQQPVGLSLRRALAMSTRTREITSRPYLLMTRNRL